jgi:hypothetical protein
MLDGRTLNPSSEDRTLGTVLLETVSDRVPFWLPLELQALSETMQSMRRIAIRRGVTRPFYASRAHSTRASQGRSIPRRLRSSASAYAAFCFRSPAKRTSAARTACASSRLTWTSWQKRPACRFRAPWARLSLYADPPGASSDFGPAQPIGAQPVRPWKLGSSPLERCGYWLIACAASSTASATVVVKTPPRARRQFS